MALVDYDSIGDGGGDEGKAIRENGPRGVEVEGDEGQRVAENRDEQGQVSKSGQRFQVPYGIVDEIRESTYPTNQANLQKKIGSALKQHPLKLHASA